MADETNQRENIYSTKVRAGKRRTYFFDVRKTKGEDYYITVTESTRKFNDEGYERHKLFLYKEDFNRFLGSLTEAIDHVKHNLMPDFDYEMYERRQAEWEASLEAEAKNEGSTATEEPVAEESVAEEPTAEAPAVEEAAAEPTDEAGESTDEDLSW